MSTTTLAGAEVSLNDEGYLVDAGQWSPAICQALAEDVGIELTAKHWEVINYAREDFVTTGKSPGLRRIASHTSFAIKDLYRLFPKGPGKLIARVAGTPKPKSCL